MQRLVLRLRHDVYVLCWTVPVLSCAHAPRTNKSCARAQMSTSTARLPEADAGSAAVPGVTEFTDPFTMRSRAAVLAMAVQPEGSVSLQQLTVQPEVELVDSHGMRVLGESTNISAQVCEPEASSSPRAVRCPVVVLARSCHHHVGACMLAMLTRAYVCVGFSADPVGPEHHRLRLARHHAPDNRRREEQLHRPGTPPPTFCMVICWSFSLLWVELTKVVPLPGD